MRNLDVEEVDEPSESEEDDLAAMGVVAAVAVAQSADPVVLAQPLGQPEPEPEPEA